MSEIFIFFEKTLIKLFKTLESNSIIIEDSIEKIMLNNINNTKYLSQILCNNNGYFSKNNKECICEFCYFGKFCQHPGYYFWKSNFTTMRTLFGILYGILGMLIWYFFYKKITMENNCYIRILRILFTPKYLIMIILLIITNSKIIFNLIVSESYFFFF